METATWRGESGKQYTFSVYDLNPSLREGRKGNYIYARRGDDGDWIPVYIGQGYLAADDSLNTHPHGCCIRRKGATHFHYHPNQSMPQREAEEKDLLAAHPLAHEPDGCNGQPMRSR